MENASNALLMAGGILLAMMIVGLLIFGFTSISDYQNSQDDMKLTEQVAEFNSEYLPYEKNNLSLPELKTLYNKVESNNAENPDKQITFDSSIDIEYYMDWDFSDIPEEYKMNKSYTTTMIYGDDGYINYIKIRENEEGE